MTGSPSLTEHGHSSSQSARLTRVDDVRREVTRIVTGAPVFDMHTHLFPPEFAALSKWGIDNLLTYHYLVAELMRSTDMRPDQFRQMSQAAQADLIWDALFVRSTPL